jgi:hypothetical protein
VALIERQVGGGEYAYEACMQVTADIHWVTKPWKLDTAWQGVRSTMQIAGPVLCRSEGDARQRSCA